MTISKSQAEGLQAKVNAKGGAKAKPSQTISPKPMGKAIQIKKVDLKRDNWIGSEDDFQIAVAKLLDASGLHWFHVPNGGKRNAREGAKFKRMGVKSGVPDILILNETINSDVGLAIELKVGKNKLSENQKSFIDKMYENDWQVCVCYSVNDVIKVINHYYDLNL